MILTFLQQRSQSVINNGCFFFYEFTGSEAGRALSVPKKKAEPFDWFDFF